MGLVYKVSMDKQIYEKQVVSLHNPKHSDEGYSPENKPHQLCLL